jgi:lipoate-protein ligase B
MLEIEWAGRLDYKNAWELQKQLVDERDQNPDLDDKLLLLEHPPTYTLGRHGNLDNLLLDQATLNEQGFALHRVDRGGDITYHGPGQLVGYPILNLKRMYGAGIGRIRRYVTNLETILIQVLDSFAIKGQRFENHRGVWVLTEQGMKKVAAIGIHVTAKGISSHGFALNVNPDLNHYSGIIPCGIQNHGVTSMAEILSTPLPLFDVIPHVVDAFGDILSIKTKFEGIEYANH